MSSRDANYATEAQNIINMINEKYSEIERVLETYRNNFSQIATDFESVGRMFTTLQSEINQRHSLVQIVNRRESDQQSETSSNSSDSSQRSFSNIYSVIWNQFKVTFDRIMAEKACSFDDMCGIVAVDLLNLGVGKLSRDMIKNYYHRINDLRGRNLDKIGAWVDSKTVNSVNSE